MSLGLGYGFPQNVVKFGSSIPILDMINLKSAVKKDVFSSSSTSFTDVPGLTTPAITLANTSSQVLVKANIAMSTTNGGYASGFQIVRTISGVDTVIGVGDAAGTRTRVSGAQTLMQSSEISHVTVEFPDAPASVGPITYRIQVITQTSGTIYVNQRADDVDLVRMFRPISSLIVMEIPG